MTKIGNVELEGRLILAPMAGVTDIAFRHICRRHGAALTVTEMVSAIALSYGDSKTLELMRSLPGDEPTAVQLFGHDAALMGEMAQRAHEITNCPIIDINMGCPVGKIVSNGDGSALMKDIDLAHQIVENVSKNAGCAVTVKFRKGWDKGSVNAVQFAKMCEAAGAAAITVHGRTRVQMYEGKADWDIIRDVKSAVSIPVIANGDVWDENEAVHIIEYTGCDMAMVGRGAFGNPWIFSRGDAALSGREIPAVPTVLERVDTVVEQIELSASLRNEKIACLEARRHVPWYLRGVRDAAFYRNEAVKIETLEDLHKLARRIKRELR